MKKASYIAILLSCIITVEANAQNIGINNTDPKTSLDIKGGLATRAVILTPFANAVNIPDNSSFVEVGPGTAAVTCISSSFIDGQRLVILNKGGYDNIFNGIIIPPNQSREFICRDPGGWTLLSGATANESWSLKGNAGTDTSVNFIGTKDDNPLRFKINNEHAGLIDRSNGNTGLGYLSLNPEGFSNTAFGANSLSSNKSGYNVAIGRNAMPGDVNGVNNVAIGASSLSSSKNSNGTVAIGYQAANSDTAANGIIAIGRAALKNGVNLQNIVAIGDSALYNYTINSGVTHNIAIGTKALYGTSGLYKYQNTAVGSYAMAKNNVLTNNTAIGAFSLYSNMGDGNTAVGSLSLLYNLGGLGNTAVGTESLFKNENGSYNVAMGYAALHSNIDGQNNIAFGNDALYYNLNSSGSIAIGEKALRSDTAANGTVAIGRAALYNNNGRAGNLAIGDSALFSNGIGSLGLTDALSNTAIGSKALLKNQNGSYNTAVGNNALMNGTFGKNNTAIGTASLLNNNVGWNTGIGVNALLLNTSGSYNIAIGVNTLYANNGNFNIAIGNGAGFNEMGDSKLYIENSSVGKDNALIYGDFAADSLLLNAKTVVRNNAVVKGYTKLGGYEADVPSIKMKKMVLTNGPSGFTSPFIHGLTQSKILSVTVLINASTGNDIPPRSTYAGFEYDYYVGTTNIFIKNITGNDASIANRPIKILITYEE